MHTYGIDLSGLIILLIDSFIPITNFVPNAWLMIRILENTHAHTREHMCMCTHTCTHAEPLPLRDHNLVCRQIEYWMNNLITD